MQGVNTRGTKASPYHQRCRISNWVLITSQIVPLLCFLMSLFIQVKISLRLKISFPTETWQDKFWHVPGHMQWLPWQGLCLFLMKSNPRILFLFISFCTIYGQSLVFFCTDDPLPIFTSLFVYRSSIGPQKCQTTTLFISKLFYIILHEPLL